jgi:hypothetical protein
VKTFLLLVLTAIPVWASNAQDEQTVRQAYAKLAYAVQSHTVFDVVRHTPEATSLDLAKQLQANELRFEISDMSSGAISDVSNKPYSDFVTKPDTQPVLQITHDEETFDENGKRATTYFAFPKWAHGNEAQEDWNTSLGKALEMSGNAGKFSRYVTATITVRFQQKSRTYRALWLFGSEMLVMDLVSGQIAGDFLKESAYPSVLTDTSLRSRPAVKEWLTATQRFEPSCKTGKQDVCCDSTMQCGVSSEDLQSKKPAPNTKDVPKGGL